MNRDTTQTHNDLVWKQCLDGRFLVEVRRIAAYQGELIIYDDHQDKKEILRKRVDLSYNAQFGPDVDDVTYWEEQCIEFIDNKFPPQI